MTTPSIASGRPRAAAGYDEGFLAVPVPLPSPLAAGPFRVLPYTHFTVVLDPLRRLAAVTAVNIDGARIVDVGRGDDWHLDERIPVEEARELIGDQAVYYGTQLPAASNGKAKAELPLALAHPSWREGFRSVFRAAPASA